MRKAITAKLVENLRPLTNRRLEVRDVLQPGFGIRVTVTGARSWFAMGRVDGRQYRHTLGSYPTVSLAEAREAARLVLRDMQLGIYAATSLDPGPAAQTLAEVSASFVELYARPRNRGWKAAQASLTKFDSLSHRPIEQIERREVARVLDEIVASGTPIAANRALAVIKKLFSWALDRGLIDRNPAAGMKAPARERSRDRVLSRTELRALWSAAETLGFPFGLAIQLMLLTAQRRGEVVGMRWSNLDLDQGLWLIPGVLAKNGRPHEVPLTQCALRILHSIPRFAGSDFVFTTTGRSPISGFGRVKQRLELATGTADWWLHDLRRTAASGMASLGIAPHVIEKVLNHVSGEISGVAAVYNRHGYRPEKAQALERWAEYVRDSTEHDSAADA